MLTGAEAGVADAAGASASADGGSPGPLEFTFFEGEKKMADHWLLRQCRVCGRDYHDGRYG